MLKHYCRDNLSAAFVSSNFALLYDRLCEIQIMKWFIYCYIVLHLSFCSNTYIILRSCPFFAGSKFSQNFSSDSYHGKCQKGKLSKWMRFYSEESRIMSYNGTNEIAARMANYLNLNKSTLAAKVRMKSINKRRFQSR